jgi:hypothetical protein
MKPIRIRAHEPKCRDRVIVAQITDLEVVNRDEAVTNTLSQYCSLDEKNVIYFIRTFITKWLYIITCCSQVITNRVARALLIMGKAHFKRVTKPTVFGFSDSGARTPLGFSIRQQDEVLRRDVQEVVNFNHMYRRSSSVDSQGGHQSTSTV